MKMDSLDQLAPHLQLHKTKILVVDDNHDIRCTLRSLLENEYSHVYEAEDGETALALYKEHHPDIVLLDVLMPGMSGYDVCREINKMNEDNVPILMVTSDESSQAIEKAFAAGATDYVSKNFNWTLLFIRVRLLLERYRNEHINRYLQKRLAQTQKFQAIGTLTGGIAHDFNNILYSILGYSKLAMDFIDSPNSKLHHFLKEIYHSTMRASDLVSQLLVYSGNRKTTEEIIDVGLLVRSTLERIQYTFPGSIDFKIEEEIKASVKGNMLNLSQALINLFENARQAMDDNGTILVSIRACTLERLLECDSCKELFTLNGLMLTVADSGNGLSSNDRDHMFDPFYSNSGNNKAGLGLSLVHGIIHEMGGHIGVESVKNQGTKIHIYLPNTEVNAS